MGFDKHEANEWALTVNQAADEYLEVRDKVLDESAARGFPAATGEGLSQLLAAGFKTKAKLSEANGKLYEKERNRVYEATEFDLKLAVQVAKLAMQFYREKLFNALIVEQAEIETRSDMHRADVERLQADVEVRQASIIQARAAALAEVNAAKLALVAAERASLPAELAYVNAQLETAQARLAIIDSIYEVIAAENLVLAAEQLRAAALADVVAAKEQVAAVKQSMIPDYMAKAEAQQNLAAAVKVDAENRMALENLGHNRNAVKQAEGAAESSIRAGELAAAVAAEALVRANAVLEMARTEGRTKVQKESNKQREAALAKHTTAEMTRISTRVESALNRRTAELGAEAALIGARVNNETNLIRNLLQDVTKVGVSRQGAVVASGNETIFTNETTDERIIISKD